MRAPELLSPSRGAAGKAPLTPADPEVSLAQYALVLAARDEGASLDVALEAARVPPDVWPSAEEERSRWLLASAADPASMRAFDAAMKDARAALHRPVPPLDEDIGAWGRWLCAWSTAADPTAELDRHGLRMADVLRLTERWTERMLEDRALAERFAAEMQGNPSPLAVRPGRSPLLTAAEEAVASRRAAGQPRPEPLPSLLGPLPGDAPGAPSPGAPSPEVPAPEVPAPVPQLDIPVPAYLAPVQPAIAGSPAAPAMLPSFMASAAATGEPPEWTVERYAALCAQLAANPSGAEATFAEYGLSDMALRTSVDRQMQARLARDPAAMAEWRAAYARYGTQRPTAAASAPRAAPGASKHVTRPMPATPGPAPLPFDPNANSTPLPSSGPQIQSGLTGDVDLSAIIRKVLAFGPQGAQPAPPAAQTHATPPHAAPPPTTPVAMPAPVPPLSMPVAMPAPVPPLSMPVAMPAPVPPLSMPVAMPAPVPPLSMPVAMPAPVPPPPPVPAPAPPTSYGETTDIDITAVARRVLAFEKPQAPGGPPRLAEPAAPPPAAAAPPGKRLVRFDPNTGAPLATPYWEDIPVPPKQT